MSTTTEDLIVDMTPEISNITLLNTEMMSTPILEEDGGDDGSIYWKILIFLATYIYPIVVIVGCLSNALGFAVMQRQKLRCLSVCVYFSFLAVSDSLVLILDFMNNWFKDVAGMYLIGVNTPLCILYRYAFEVFFTYSAWLIVAITIERVIVILLPLKAKAFTSVFRARIACVVIFAMACIYKMYNLPIWEVSDEGKCDWKPGWEKFHLDINMILNFSAYSYIPSVTLIVCNILIIVQIWKSFAVRGAMTQEKDTSTNDARKITFMVLVISFSYIILTVPLSAYYTIQYADNQFIDMTPQMAMGEIIILLVGLNNHGINFYLYVIASKNFRSELKAMFGFYDKKTKKHKANNLYGKSSSTGGESKSRSYYTTETNAVGVTVPSVSVKGAQ